MTANEQILLACFRLLKALLRRGFGNRALMLTVVTQQTCAVFSEDAVDPDYAGIHGLLGTLAKEYPLWQVRVLDWPATAMKSETAFAASLGEIPALPFNTRGDAIACRRDRWFRQELIPIKLQEGTPTRHRHGGVYVLLGGAGGVGRVYTEHLVSRYAAQTVWIGRRPPDADIAAAIQSIGAYGPAPAYIQADAADPGALALALEQVHAQYGGINGIVHSALALHDQSLANMDESVFRAGLKAKVDVCVSLGHTLVHAPSLQSRLDFVLFFSSLQSFTKAAGQSNYAAGCTYKDSYAAALSRELLCDVRVINWGYWSDVGSVSSVAYRQRMSDAGVMPIDHAAAMHALERLLACAAPQICFTYVSLQAREEEVGNFPARLLALQRSTPANAWLQPEIERRTGQLALPRAELDKQASMDLDLLLARLLLDRLTEAGFFQAGAGVEEQITLARRAGMAGKYEQWLRASVDFLCALNVVAIGDHGRLTVQQPVDPAATSRHWQAQRRALTGLQPQLALVEAMFSSLSPVLRGHPLR
jgi:NAD(P)-dependent dehydrogenase (short-subunit alcohol dehydrogenase family)